MTRKNPFTAALLALAVLLPGSASAQDILPVAQGRFSITVALDRNTARPPTGSWIEFIGKDAKSVPRRIGVVGFVLGTRDDVVFIELSVEDATRLEQVEAAQPVRIQQFAAPDPEAVAERQKHADSAQPVTLAPRMRTVTVSIGVDEEHVKRWTPGEVLTFPDLGEIRFRPSITGLGTRGYDVEAMFVAARQTGPDRFDVTLIAEPRDAFTLLKAAAENRLAVDPRGEAEPETEAEQRCFIKHRRGIEIVNIQIPCE